MSRDSTIPRSFLLLLILLPNPPTANCLRFPAREKAPNITDPFSPFAARNFWQELTTPYTSGYEDSGIEETGPDEEDDNATPPLPFFENYANSTNVTVQLGHTVTLHCKVNDLDERTVSWIRRKGEEIHLLTFGLHTYASDSRISLIFRPPNNWMLQIKYANERDKGYYECQVSSHPPLIYYVLLDVIVPRVDIVDERWAMIDDKFYKEGSTIELNCVVSHVPNPTSYVTWKHGQRILNYDIQRGGISVKTDILPDGAMSRLFIANANYNDSGNYTCALGRIASTSVYIHILKDELPSAMQHGGSGGRNDDDSSWFIMFLMLPLSLSFQSAKRSLS